MLALCLLAQWAGLEWYLQLHGMAPALMDSLTTACDVLIGDCQPRSEGSASPPVVGLLTVPQFLLGTAALFALMQLGSRLSRRYEKTFSNTAVRNLKETRAHVLATLVPQKHRLYKAYLDQCCSDVLQ